MHIVCMGYRTEQLTRSAHASPITIGSRPALSSSFPASLVPTLLSLPGCGVTSSGSGVAVAMMLTERKWSEGSAKKQPTRHGEHPARYAHMGKLRKGTKRAHIRWDVRISTTDRVWHS